MQPKCEYAAVQLESAKSYLTTMESLRYGKEIAISKLNRNNERASLEKVSKRDL